MCRRSQGASERKPRRTAYFNLARRAPEPDHAHVDASLHPAHQRLLKEAGQPYPRAGALLLLLQLRPDA